MSTDRLSDAEHLMWRLEVDPWFASSFGALTVLDGPVDHDYVERKLLAAVAAIPRLRQRVIERAADNPSWQTDGEFDLGHHFRRLRLADPTQRGLFDLATRLVADPLDRSRPLWRFTLIEDLPGDRTALLTKMHHSVTDGEGGVQIALHYLDLAPELQELDGRDVLEDRLAEVISGEAPPENLDAALEALRATAGRHLSRWRGALGEAAMYLADPARLPEQAANARATLQQLTADLPSGEASNSLWNHRSRRRHLEHVGFTLAPALDAARAHGGTLNDLLLVIMSEAADRYHQGDGVDLDRLQGSFIISTRDDNTGIANAFSPSMVELPGAGLAPEDRFALIAGRAEEAKTSRATRSELQNALAGPAKFVPVSGLTALARRQSSRLDLATSNLRSAPVPLYVGGAKAVANVPIGPVAGTACNATLMSYDTRADIGLHLDPAAITDPARWRECVEAAFDVYVPGGHRHDWPGGQGSAPQA